MRTKVLVGIIAGLSLLATACGDDDVEDASDATVTSEPAATSPDTVAATPATEPAGSGHDGGRRPAPFRRRSSRCHRRRPRCCSRSVPVTR